jgi:hypothetical protein
MVYRWGSHSIQSCAGGTGTLHRYRRKSHDLTTKAVLGFECSLHGRNIEDNLQSDGQSILEFPEVHDWHIEKTPIAPDGAMSSADNRDTVTAVDNAFNSHMVFQVRADPSKEDLRLLNSTEDAAPWNLRTLCDVNRRR